jgi:hypothetical protein
VTPTLVGLLADERRLRLFAAIALGARTVDEVATAAELDVSDVQSLLPRLVAGGLVEQRDGLRVSMDTLRSAARDRPARDRGAPDATDEQQRVLRNFVEDGRLTRLPARHGQKRIVLEYVATRSEPGREYTEREVNERLQELHDDYVALRRYLVDEGLLVRAAGVYARTR